MSRSANHQRSRHANNRPYSRPGHVHRRDNPDEWVSFCGDCNLPDQVWFSHEVRTLRYDRNGAVTSVVRTVVARDYAGVFNRSEVQFRTRKAQRAARSAWRNWSREAAKVANGGCDLDELDPPAPRHRHHALWDSW